MINFTAVIEILRAFKGLKNYVIKNKRIILFTIIGIIFGCTAGYFYGVYRCNKRVPSPIEQGDELKQQLNNIQQRCSELESELNKRVSDCEQFELRTKSIKSDINNIIELSERSGRLVQSIGDTVSEIDKGSSNAIEIIQRLRTNQYTIKSLCTELCDENRELRIKLGELQESIDKQ